jgi:hypothetical protein
MRRELALFTLLSRRGLLGNPTLPEVRSWSQLTPVSSILATTPILPPHSARLAE